MMKNRIETDRQLSMQYDALQAEIDALTEQRRGLYQVRRSGYGGDAVSEEIAVLTGRLRTLRRELKLCIRIEGDLSKVETAVHEGQVHSRSEVPERADRKRNYDRGR